MRYRDAKKLHNEDEVIRKSDNVSLTVVSTEIYKKCVIILCDDGNNYHHTEIR